MLHISIIISAKIISIYLLAQEEEGFTCGKGKIEKACFYLFLVPLSKFFKHSFNNILGVMKIQPESLSSYSVVIYMLNLLIQDNFLLRRNEGG